MINLQTSAEILKYETNNWITLKFTIFMDEIFELAYLDLQPKSWMNISYFPRPVSKSHSQKSNKSIWHFTARTFLKLWLSWWQVYHNNNRINSSIDMLYMEHFLFFASQTRALENKNTCSFTQWTKEFSLIPFSVENRLQFEEWDIHNNKDDHKIHFVHFS